MWINYKANALAMAFLANGNKVRSILNKEKIMPFDRIDYKKISLISPIFAEAKSAKEYIKLTGDYVKNAAQSGAGMIIFPKYYGDQAAFCSPLADDLIEYFVTSYVEGFPDSGFLYKLVKETQTYTREIYFNTFAFLAEAYNVYISAGTLFVIEDGKLICNQYIFSPEGRISAIQDNIFLSEFEEKMGVSFSNKPKVFNTKIGNISLLTSQSLNYFEPFLAISEKEAQIVILSGGINESSLIKARIRSEHHNLYILSAGYRESAIDGMPFDTGSYVITPRAMSNDNRGVLVSGDKDAVVVVEIDVPSLKLQFDPYNGDRNIGYLKKIWRDKNDAKLS